MTRLVPCCRGLAALARIGAVSTRVRVNTLFSWPRGRRVNMGFTVMTHPCVTAALPVSPRLARQHGPTRGDAQVCHRSSVRVTAAIPTVSTISAVPATVMLHLPVSVENTPQHNPILAKADSLW